MAQTGRNEPCPCGSGKKYKKCCLEQEQSTARNTAAGVSTELQQAMDGHEFNSLEEAQAFTDNFMGQRNQKPSDDFHGLSPEQMHHVLNFPFTSPHLVDFPEKLESLPDAPILSLLTLLVEAIGEKGLKPTAKGNLPRNFCREAALAYWDEETYKRYTRFGNVNKEEDFFELHVTRVVVELAGLIRKYKGRFILSRECRRLLSNDGLQSIYPRLLKVYAEQFNWGYRDGYAEAPFIQHAFLFSLYLINRYGDDWRPAAFYEDNFLQAFPAVLDEVEHYPDCPPDWAFRSCYTLRTLVNFADFMGLAKVERVDGKKLYEYNYRVKKLPLLNLALHWNVLM
ncbi:MAG: hypothetical protein DRQ40_09130 [Gammaproteobacteria bacterium]|nr:MAG: hypothetical protein DRQ40_09130 [Gammaproteobacteria bacterium]